MSDAPDIPLAPPLKALKLPTFLREHQTLARQCAAEGVDHVRYLARLVELELLDRERRMVERRIKAAKVPAVKQKPGQLQLRRHPEAEQDAGSGTGAV